MVVKTPCSCNLKKFTRKSAKFTGSFALMEVHQKFIEVLGSSREVHGRFQWISSSSRALRKLEERTPRRCPGRDSATRPHAPEEGDEDQEAPDKMALLFPLGGTGWACICSKFAPRFGRWLALWYPPGCRVCPQVGVLSDAQRPGGAYISVK